MRIFLLEDDAQRLAMLLKWFGGPIEWDVVDTCANADKFKPPYDLILLDHDLGGRQMEDHEDCGLEFVKLIEGFINDDATIIIHSYNPAGAKAMYDRLARGNAIIAPFGSGKFMNIVKGVIYEKVALSLSEDPSVEGNR